MLTAGYGIEPGTFKSLDDGSTIQATAIQQYILYFIHFLYVLFLQAVVAVMVYIEL